MNGLEAMKKAMQLVESIPIEKPAQEGPKTNLPQLQFWQGKKYILREMQYMLDKHGARLASKSVDTTIIGE